MVFRISAFVRVNQLKKKPSIKWTHTSSTSIWEVGETQTEKAGESVVLSLRRNNFGKGKQC